MLRFGASPQQVQQALGSDHDCCLVLPENWPALLWFLEVSDLVRFSDFGRCLGLDLVQVQAEAALAGRSTNADQFAKLRHLSRAVMTELNRRHQRELR